MLPSPVTFLKNHVCSRPQHRIICMEDAQRIPWFPHINPGCCENIWCLRLHEPGFSLLMNKMAGPWWLPRNREIKKYINMLFHSQINKTVYVISSAGSIHGCSLLWKVTRWHLSESKLQSDGLGKGLWLSQTPDSLPLKQKANRMTHRNAHLSIQWLCCSLQCACKDRSLSKGELWNGGNTAVAEESQAAPGSPMRGLLS